MYEFDVGNDPIEKYHCLHDENVLVDGVEVCTGCGLPMEIINEMDISEEELYVLDKKHNRRSTEEENEEILEWANMLIEQQIDGRSIVVKQMKMSDVVVKIKKRQFNLLRTLGFNGYLYKGVESCAILYGKKGIITKVKRYDAIQSAGLVTSNITDIMKVLHKKNFMGVFHSHLFESSTPSIVDTESLSGWKAARMPKPVFSLIGSMPHFKMRCWSMDEDFKIQEHPLEVI